MGANNLCDFKLTFIMLQLLLAEASTDTSEIRGHLYLGYQLDVRFHI